VNVKVVLILITSGLTKVCISVNCRLQDIWALTCYKQYQSLQGKQIVYSCRQKQQ